ncbi:MAG: hypothetical protein K6G26_08200 [Lachnospiraceae bacterium]|nr:hypothetical protein [Lachnospiraceae bacterium]
MHKKKKSVLQQAQDEAQNAINKTNEKIEELGDKTGNLYEELTEIQSLFDNIRNVPSENRIKYEEVKRIRLNWKQQAEKIEKDYNDAVNKSMGAGVVGTGVGFAVFAMGPTAAMGIATTFGVASTGTAISTLSGAAATNAALAWLGGGALATGGGGMVAGEAFLALAGPVGWTIAGVALLGSALAFWNNRTNKKHLESVFTMISQRDIKSYNLAIVELNERISRIIDESSKLKNAISEIMTFGQDYKVMSEEQQYKLGSYVNLMLSSTQLLVNPIKGIQPKYTQEDMNKFLAWNERNANTDTCYKYQDMIIMLANFIYKIELNDRDKKLLWKSLRKNKDMLKSMDISKKEFDMAIFDAVYEALDYKYSVN